MLIDYLLQSLLITITTSTPPTITPTTPGTRYRRRWYGRWYGWWYGRWYGPREHLVGSCRGSDGYLCRDDHRPEYRQCRRTQRAEDVPGEGIEPCRDRIVCGKVQGGTGDALVAGVGLGARGGDAW